MSLSSSLSTCVDGDAPTASCESQSSVHWAQGIDASILPRIFEQGITIAVMQRALSPSLERSIQAQCDTERRWSFQWLGVPDAAMKRELRRSMPAPEQACPLLDDVVLLTQAMAMLFDTDTLGIRLRLLDSAMWSTLSLRQVAGATGHQLSGAGQRMAARVCGQSRRARRTLAGQARDASPGPCHSAAGHRRPGTVEGRRLERQRGPRTCTSQPGAAGRGDAPFVDHRSELSRAAADALPGAWRPPAHATRGQWILRRGPTERPRTSLSASAVPLSGPSRMNWCWRCSPW